MRKKYTLWRGVFATANGYTYLSGGSTGCHINQGEVAIIVDVINDPRATFVKVIASGTGVAGWVYEYLSMKDKMYDIIET